MPGIWILIIGLIVTLIGIYRRKRAGQTRLSLVLAGIGVLMMGTGAMLFVLVSADIIAFPLH